MREPLMDARWALRRIRFLADLRLAITVPVWNRSLLRADILFAAGQVKDAGRRSTLPSAMLPLRAALLRKSRHALAAIIEGEGGMKEAPLEKHPFVQACLKGAIDRLLTSLHHRL